MIDEKRIAEIRERAERLRAEVIDVTEERLAMTHAGEDIPYLLDAIDEFRSVIGQQAYDAQCQAEKLQAQLAEEVSRRYQAECNYDHAVADRDESQRREQAAVEDMGKCGGTCHVCKRDEDDTCGDYEGCNFLWRGPQEVGEGR